MTPESTATATTAPPVYHVLWTDDGGIPCYVVAGGQGHPEAFHPVAGWRLKAYVYLDGTVRMLSADFGARFFSPAPFHPGCRTAVLRVGGERVSLDQNRLAADRRGTVTRELRPGDYRAEIRLPGGTLEQRVVHGGLDARHLFIGYRWFPVSPHSEPPTLFFPVDVPGAEVGDGPAWIADAGRYGSVAYHAAGNEVDVGDRGFTARLDTPLVIRAGYGERHAAAPSEADVAAAAAELAGVWRKHLSPLTTRLHGRELHELRWSLSHLVTTAVYDGTRGHRWSTNGGLYLFDHRTARLDQPYGEPSFRDGNQAAFGLAAVFPGMARDQIFGSVAAFRHDLGIPQVVNLVPGGEHGYKAPGSGEGNRSAAQAMASDQVYWFGMALTEYLRVTGDDALFDTHLTNAHGETKPVRAHLDDMLRFIDQTVGYGPHGLCRILSGDWNDCFGRVGRDGKGESFFNTYLNIIVKQRLAAVLEARGERDVPIRLRNEAAALRHTVNGFLDGAWSPRAISDDGRLIGASGERIFLESQSWMAMARCGTAETRKAALLAAVERCRTPIGPAMFDPPMSRQEWARIARAPYPSGAGENGGVWWITGYWLAMALAAEGLDEVAEQVYRSCAMWHHHERFGSQWWSPFMAPDGVSGPASPYFGQPQQAAEGMDRERNPLEVAKYAYKVWFATHRGSPDVCW